MKSLVVAFALLGITYSASAQKGELSTAKTNYEKFTMLKQAGSDALAKLSLMAAKTSIDKVVLNDKTVKDASAWAYKSLIDANIAALDTNKIASDNAMKIAVTEYWKSVELDTDKKYADILKMANDFFTLNEYNKAVKFYQSEDYQSAMNSFMETAKFLPNDTTINHYTGLSAQNSGNYTKAIECYEFCLTRTYSGNKNIAYDLARVYYLNKDTTKAISTAALYAEKYNDSSLSELEIQFSIEMGQEKGILTKLQNQVILDPNNKRKFFLLGVTYEKLKDIKNAESAYKKALDIDRSYNDASLNLAVLILNNAVDLIQFARQIDPKKVSAYDTAKKNAEVEFERALPYINHAIETNPKNINAWGCLKQYYIFKNNMKKVDEITTQITALQ